MHWEEGESMRGVGRTLRQGTTNPGPAFRAALPEAGPAFPRKVMMGEVQQEGRGQVRRMLSEAMKE